MTSITWPQVWARRLARHSLDRRAPAGEMVEIAGKVCGIHAQVMSAAELSLGIRVAGISRQDVQAALWEERTLVKTYGLRGTVHLFPAQELPTWMAALSMRTPSELPRLSRVGLERGQLEAIISAIRIVLDERRLTLRQLGDALMEQLGAWVSDQTAPAFGGTFPRWRMALGAAAAAGALCFGPNVGTAVTFVRPDQWLGGWRVVDPRAALTEVFRRYLWAYGPTTARDFGQWFNLPLPLAQATAKTLGDQLEEVDVEGFRCLQIAGDSHSMQQEAADIVRLLPHFDCYLVGCHPRNRLVPPLWAHRALEHGGAGPIPVLIVNGVVAGVWERRKHGRHVEIAVDPFATLTVGQLQTLEAEARNLGQVLQAEMDLEVGPIVVRPHL